MSSSGYDIRRQRLRRARPVIALAVVALAAGLITGAAHSPSPSTHRLAARFVAAWARRDYAAMYADIDPAAQRELSLGDFAQAYETAAMTATATAAQVAGGPHDARGQ